ncbi:MAG: hypothetical protein JRN15_11085 [Nitrososphaerota archaeon]|nr:hypothetical protein [Nitrososphaerota archaeon]
MQLGDIDLHGKIDVRCPVCNAKTDNLTCKTHGSICESCGTLYNGKYCTDCFTSDLAVPTKKVAAGSVGLGEGRIPQSGYRYITGHGQLSKREINILQAASAEEPSRLKIHRKAEAAIRWLALPRNTEIGLLETVERKAISIASRLRMEAGRPTRVSSEKVVAYSLLIMAKQIGKTIVEVQESLARAGFNIKLQQLSFRIAVPFVSNISSVNMYVNGWKRDSKLFKPKEVGEGPLGKEYAVSVQTFLSDAIDQNGTLSQTCKVHFENALVLAKESAIIGHTSSQTMLSDRTINTSRNDHSTVWIKLESKRCFALFKSINRMLEKSIEAKDNDGGSDEIGNSVRRHLSLPSKKFPASAALMRKAHCLDKFERRSVELFRESLNNSNGKSRRTLARQVLFQADKEIFASLPKPVRQYMKGYITTLPLKRKDRSYVGIKGLVIPGEVLGIDSNWSSLEN